MRVRTKNGMFCRACLVAGVGLLPMASSGEENVPPAEVAAAKAPPAAAGTRAARAALSSERINALLAEIPDDHPMREELRLVVRQGPPEGFSAEEWLRLAMKFNFRMPGSQRLRQTESD